MIDHHGMCTGHPCNCEALTGPTPIVAAKQETEAIGATDWRRPEHIDISQILLLPNVSAGMNPYVVMSLTYLYRSTSEDVEPIKVMGMGGGLYRIIDGRHRFVASVMAGRKSVLALEVSG